MSFDIKDYKLKHIISLKDGLLEYTSIPIKVEGVSYPFKIDNVQSEIMELITYFKYYEIKRADGPLEKILKGFTYGKSRSEMNDHEVYEIRFSKFNAKIENKSYEFEITGVGPSALKISLFLKYDEIEKEQTKLETVLKELILDEHTDIVLNNDSYKEKLIQMKKDDEEYQSKMDELDEEIRREQEEKERKWRELEARLNSS